ncbi:MAG: hypothetical protein J6Z47_04710 [Bacteroidales bacterium]|nr:hypothetical protein [Bacteroidales bacterium]
MKKFPLSSILIFLSLFLFGCRNNATEEAIRRQLTDYPESTVRDIYKSFCQDNLGPEHLIQDPGSARNYLESELSTYREDLDSLRYAAPGIYSYPVGDKGNYVRVDLSAVLDGLVGEDVLLDAFIRSANSGRKVSLDEWADKWKSISGILRKDFGYIPGAEEDLRILDSLVAAGTPIIHHSPAFRAAYHPHYRIVAKDIFESELKHLIIQ